MSSQVHVAPTPPAVASAHLAHLDTADMSVESASHSPSQGQATTVAAPSSTVPKATPAPWGWGAAKPKPTSVSLRDVEVEEMYFKDADLAAQLQQQERGSTSKSTNTAGTQAASSAMPAPTAATSSSSSAGSLPVHEKAPQAAALTEEEQFLADMELAMRLSAEEQSHGQSPLSHPDHAYGPTDTDDVIFPDTDSVPTSVAAPEEAKKTPEGEGTDTSQDVAIALALQEQFDKEYDASIDQLEYHATRSIGGGGKVSVSMDNFRTYPVDRSPPSYDMTPEEEEEDWADEIDEAFEFDRKLRGFRDRQGVMVTKHNLVMSGKRNSQKLEALCPSTFNSGNLRGSKSQKNDIRLSNKVYNELRTFAQRDSKRGARIREAKDHSTAVMAMDKATRVIAFKMINRGELDQVNGVVSTGKESVIFHCVRTPTPEESQAGDHEQHDEPEHAGEQEDCVLKVFKTTLTEFTARHQFLHGDRRYDSRVGKQHARKLVRLWAEKEMANLARLEKAGVPCPRVIAKRKHILVLSFIGKKGRAAPKLKEMNWERKSQKHLISCYHQVEDHLQTMYRDCKLVHCDLSEYNILWHNNTAHIIDVGQSVDVGHPHALNYLYRDCVNIHRYFSKMGCPGVLTGEELYAMVTGNAISTAQGGEALKHINMSTKRHIAHEGTDEGDTGSSNVVLRQHTLTLEELQHIVSEEPGDEEDDEEDDEGDDEEDEDGGVRGPLEVEVDLASFDDSSHTEASHDDDDDDDDGDESSHEAAP